MMGSEYLPYLLLFVVGIEGFGGMIAFFFASDARYRLRGTSLGLRILSSVLALDAWRSESNDAWAI